MTMYQVELFRTPSGKEPIAEFLRSLQPSQKARVNFVLELLAKFGPQLRAPYSKKLSGYRKLFELRTTGKISLRLIYTNVKNKFYILNVFFKKTNKTPKKEIETALVRSKTLT